MLTSFPVNLAEIKILLFGLDLEFDPLWDGGGAYTHVLNCISGHWREIQSDETNAQ